MQDTKPELDLLRERVRELEADNAKLRSQIASAWRERCLEVYGVEPEDL